MGLSNIDSTTLETLQQFSAFFDMIKNPDKYASVVADANKVIKEMKSVIETYTTVIKANEYLESAKKMLAQVQNTAIADKAEIAKLKEKANQAANAKEQRLAEKDQQNNEAHRAIVERQSDVEKKEKELKKEQEEFYLLRTHLNDRAAILDAKERELNDKASKLKQLLG